MMMVFGVPWGHLLVAFAVAALVTGIELLTSKYPRTVRFALSSPWFYVYLIIYGLLGAAALALVPLVSDQLTVEGIGATNPWMKAVLVGFSIKAVLHIRIFSVTTGPGQSFPVGLESFVQLFEPWMLRTVELDHYSAQSTFITPRAARFANAAAAQTQAKSNPPPGLSSAERAVFESDIDQAATPAQVIAAYLKYAGIKLTMSTFP
jgi:hypothetical protein